MIFDWCFDFTKKGARVSTALRPSFCTHDGVEGGGVGTLGKEKTNKATKKKKGKNFIDLRVWA